MSLSLFLFALLPSVPVRNGSGHVYTRSRGSHHRNRIVEERKKEGKKERARVSASARRENVS